MFLLFFAYIASESDTVVVVSDVSLGTRVNAARLILQTAR